MIDCRSEVRFENSGEFLGWWFSEKIEDQKAQEIFNRYYSNYIKRFDGNLRQFWTNRHLELENEIRSLKEKPKPRILDLGCGTGSIALYLAGKLQKKCQVLGVDVNKNRLFCAIERQKVLETELRDRLNCRFICSNLHGFDDQEKFDLVYLEETLHHLEPRNEAVRKISNLTKRAGKVIISETNALNPIMQMKLFMNRGTKTIIRKIDSHGQAFLYGKERILTATSAVSAFAENGLKPKSIRFFGFTTSKLAKVADKHDIDLKDIEKMLGKLPFVNRFLSIHYNIVLSR